MVYIIRDIQPFRSPVDRKVITSRSELREHNKRNGVIEVGNEYQKQAAEFREMERDRQRSAEREAKEHR